jgi:segregation and condensation protein B
MSEKIETPPAGDEAATALQEPVSVEVDGEIEGEDAPGSADDGGGASEAEASEAEASGASEADSSAEEGPSAEDDQPTEEEQEEEAELGAGELLSDEELERAAFALIFASPEPLGTRRLAQQLQSPKLARLKAALEAISARLVESGMPLELREIAGGWRFLTAEDMAEVVAGLVKARKAEKLSAAGLETLAVVAYRQPVTKADIESIRGVQCGAMLRNLVDRGLARVTGRSEMPGHALEYGTTKEFLDRFGLGSLSDLPRDGELLKE